MIANQIIAQRQFNKIVNKFTIGNIESMTVYPTNCNEQCLKMLIQEGFEVSEGQWGSHYVSLPKPGGFWSNR